MQMRRIATVVLTAVGLAAGPVYSQPQPANPTQRAGDSDAQGQGQVPVYRVTVVGRTTPAINYRHRGGATTIDFRGTPLLPDARGEAKVESKQGYIEIEVEFDRLVPATKFGREYLTYVMWAITPEGRATSLGEVLLNETSSKLNVTTELQAFGLVVTAEPYFAVTQPSDVVVLENVVRDDTRGAVEQVAARYELLKRGTYLMDMDPNTLKVRTLDRSTPLELYEARHAVQLSGFAGAERYATDTYQKASRLLQQAEAAYERHDGRRAVTMAAREAAQTAEDARLIAIERQEDEYVARATQAAAEREANAIARAQSEAQRRTQAEAERMAAERRRTDAERAAAAATREKVEADAARVAAERAKADAERAAQTLAQERAAAEAARAASEASARQARQAADQAELEKAQLRARLQQQLNVILETRESARGLIVNVSDVLFDTGRHTLKPGAREKLAKVAGILLAYPDLTLEVDGHTDSVGDESYNQDLSERRAESVRAFLVSQGIPSRAVAAIGYGEAQPVASNDTAAGRQQNRRVELVVSGDIIGGQRH